MVFSSLGCSATHSFALSNEKIAANADSLHDGCYDRGVLAVLASSGENEVRQRALELAGLSNVLRMREEEKRKRGSRRR